MPDHTYVGPERAQEALKRLREELTGIERIVF